jgi:hypothetical protein
MFAVGDRGAQRTHQPGLAERKVVCFQNAVSRTAALPRGPHMMAQLLRASARQESPDRRPLPIHCAGCHCVRRRCTAIEGHLTRLRVNRSQ